jgi:hypothetical protein
MNSTMRKGQSFNPRRSSATWLTAAVAVALGCWWTLSTGQTVDKNPSLVASFKSQKVVDPLSPSYSYSDNDTE